MLTRLLYDVSDPDDLQFGRTWSRSIDLLFIDTSHAYSHTLEELELFGQHVRERGFICLHDTVSHPENFQRLAISEL